MHKLRYLLVLVLLTSCLTTPPPPSLVADTAWQVTLMPEAQNWVIRVLEPDGITHRVTYSWTDASITLDGVGAVSPSLAMIDDIVYTITPNENSLEATWEGDSNGSVLDIHPHDRVSIWTLGYRAGESTSTYYPRWAGYSSVPANQYQTDGLMHTYRALGLYRLLETTDTGENYPIDEGQDLASGVADTMIGNVTLPGGITYSTFSAIGVTNTGKINPDSADLAQNLDALTALCHSADINAVWGVKPDGSLFFEELDANSIEVDEAAIGTIVEWTEPQADEIVTAVRWILGDGVLSEVAFDGDNSVSLETPDVATHLSESGITTYGRRVISLTPPAGVSGFSPVDMAATLNAGTLTASWVGTVQDGTPDGSRIRDANPLSYAVFEPDASGFVSILYEPSDITKDEVIGAYVKFTLDPDSDAAEAYLAYVDFFDSSAFTETTYYGLWGTIKLRSGSTSIISAPSGSDVDEVVLIGDRARGTDDGFAPKVGLNISVDAATGTPRVAISEFRFLTVNSAELDALAEQEYRFPQEAAFDARVTGQVTPAGLVNITRLNDTTVSELPVEAISTGISGTGGVRTALVVGPRTPPAISEEVHRIARRDRLAALSGARAGRR